jgi:cobalt-precorrin 5A hydrolase
MAGGSVIVAGFGFRMSATAESLADALDRAGGLAGIGAVATVADKASSLPFRLLVDRLGLTVLAIAPEDIRRQVTLTRSATSLAARGTGSVAEAAALAGAGPGARLFGPRVVSGDGRATCALAEGPEA